MIYLCIYIDINVWLYVYIYIYLSTYSCLSNLYFYSYELSLTDEWFSREHVVANKHTQVFCLSFSSFNLFKQYLSKTCVYRKSIYLCVMKQSSMLFRLSSRKWPLWKVMKFSSKETKATLWSLITSMIATWGFFFHLFQMRFIWSQLKISLVVSLSYPLSKQTHLSIAEVQPFVSPRPSFKGDSFYLLIDGIVEVVKDWDEKKTRGGGRWCPFSEAQKIQVTSGQETT